MGSKIRKIDGWTLNRGLTVKIEKSMLEGSILEIILTLYKGLSREKIRFWSWLAGFVASFEQTKKGLTIGWKPVKMLWKICEIPCDKKTPCEKPCEFCTA